MAEPKDDDSLIVAIRKLVPLEGSDELQEAAAAWLNEAFGVQEYADLEGVKQMADVAMSLVKDDNNINAAVKEILRLVLTGDAPAPGAEKSERPPPSAAELTAEPCLGLQPEAPDAEEPSLAVLPEVSAAAAPAGPPSPKAATLEAATPESAALGATESAKPDPEDTISTALQKLFPDASAEDLEPAATKLNESFAVVEYADLTGLLEMADGAWDILAKDSGISAGTKAILRKLFGKNEATPSTTPEPSGKSKAMPAVDMAKVAPAKPCTEPPPLSARGSPAIGSTSGYPMPSPRQAQPSARSSRWDDFLVLSQLGSGSFATVHKVKERTSGQYFALKQISSRGANDLEQIRREIAIHLKLKHPHVLCCNDTFSTHGFEFLVLELVQGGNLYEYMQKEKLVQSEAARLFAESASGIHYLHLKGWMHRDIKPENILLASADGEDSQRSAKIADFGECVDASVAQTKECGSPAYMSPEMAAGLAYDCRVDVWALGIMLYEMLTSMWPFPLATTILETKKKIRSMEYAARAWDTVPVPAQPLLRALIVKEPGERLPLLDVLEHPWLVSHIGTTMHLAAEAQVREHEEEAQAIAEITGQLEDYEHSLDAQAMEALLARAAAYDIEQAKTTVLKERCDALQKQTKYRRELLRCAYLTSRTDVKKVLAAAKDEALDVPTNWLLPDGPKLHARAELALAEIEMGQKGSHYAATNFVMDIEARPDSDGSGLTALEGEDEEEADLVRIYRDWQVANVKSMIDIPVMKFVISDALSHTLMGECERLEAQARAYRKLQICVVSQNLEEVQQCLESLAAEGLGSPEAWLLPGGAHLLRLAERRREEIEERRRAEAQALADLEARAKDLAASSIDASAVEEVLAALEEELGAGAGGEATEALRTRLEQLRLQQPFCVELRHGLAAEGDLDVARKAVARIQEAGLEEKQEAWLLPEGPGLMAAATRRIDGARDAEARLEAAARDFDVDGLRAALELADEHDLAASQCEAARALFLSLHNAEFVEARLAELSVGDEADSDVRVKSIQALARRAPEPFSGNKSAAEAVDTARLDAVLECTRMRAQGFPVQLQCTTFLRKYAALVPALERAGMACCGASCVPQSDLATSTQAFIEALAASIKWDGSLQSAVVVTTKVFLSSMLHGALEEALRQLYTSPAVRIQSRWRGAQLRGALSSPLKEAMAVNTSLRSAAASADGPRKSEVESANALDESLKAMDDLLQRALRLELQLPSLDTYIRARDRLAVHAQLARDIEEALSASPPSALTAEALLAYAKARGVEGPLLDRLAELSGRLGTQLRMRRLLRRCAVSESLPDAEKTLEEAQLAGLQDAAAWLVPGGSEGWHAAFERVEHLREEQARKAESETCIAKEFQDALSSLDTRQMQALVRRCKVLGKTGVLVEQLEQRRTALQRQRLQVDELVGCTALSDSDAVAGVLDRVRQAGLDAEAEWICPDGPKIFARAQAWLQRLEKEKQFLVRSKADLEQQSVVLSCSFDPTAIKALISRAERAGASLERAAELRARCSSLERQDSLSEALRRCGAEAVTATQEAGLDRAPDGWILPDGPRLMARAVAWQSWLKDISTLKDLPDMGLDGEGKSKAAAALEECLVSNCMEDVSLAVSHAKSLGLDVPRNWTDSAAKSVSASLIAAGLSRLEQLEEQPEVFRHTSADLEWQLRVLRSSLCPSLQPLLGEALPEALKKRCGALQRQLPYRKSLLCAMCEGLKPLQQAVASARSAGLEAPEAWLLPEGPALLTAAKRRIEQLKASPSAAER